jgi:hypothetical protein
MLCAMGKGDAIMRLKGIAICVLLASFFYVPSAAIAATDPDQPDVFKGTVGQAAVVMSLYPDGSQGTYFYEKYKHDILVHGSLKGHDYQLAEGLDDGMDSTSNRMALHRDGTRLTGTYTTAKGKTLPVTLVLVPPGSVPEPRPDLKLETDEQGRLAAGGDYNRLRLTGMQLTAQKRETIDGRYTVQWYLEPRSGERLFRLVAGWPPAAMVIINAQLEARQFHNALADLACAGDGASPEQITFEQVNDRFLSVQTASQWDCEGAAHPDSGVDGTTFDTRTGQALTLEDMWWLGKGAKPKEDSDAWITYRREVFAPAVARLLTQLHPKEMSKPTDDDACDYSNPEVWDIVSYWLTDQGLQLQPSFSHVQQSCESDADWAVIPYAVLEKADPALFAKSVK